MQVAPVTGLGDEINEIRLRTAEIERARLDFLDAMAARAVQLVLRETSRTRVQCTV